MHHLVADLLDASVDNWDQDPDADVDLPYLCRYGRRAIQFLFSNPGYLVVRRSTSTSLVKLPNHTYCVFRNMDFNKAEARQRLQSQPPPLPPSPWRQAQIDSLAQPLASTPWAVPTWGTSSSDPDREPIPYLDHRRARDPAHLLRHEPDLPRASRPDPDEEDDSPMESYASLKRQSRRSGRHRAPVSAHYASSASSFRGGTRLMPYAPFVVPPVMTLSRSALLTWAWTRIQTSRSPTATSCMGYAPLPRPCTPAPASPPTRKKA